MDCVTEGHLGPLSEGARRPLGLEYLTVCKYRANGSATARPPQGKVYSVQCSLCKEARKSDMHLGIIV